MPCYEPDCNDSTKKDLTNHVKKCIHVFYYKLNLDVFILYSDLYDLTAFLCHAMQLINRANPKLFEEVVYDAYNKDSRMLADWWEDHCKKDATQCS